MGERRLGHSPLLPPQGPYPWLVFEHGARGFRNHTFLTISHHHPPNLVQTKQHVRSVPELCYNVVHNSCHGWLILSDKDDNFSLFNPVALESILLPSCDKLYPETAINVDCALPSPPTDPGCVLFVFDSRLRRILFCRLENQVWFEKGYDKELGFRRSLRSPFSCSGKLYATTRFGDQVDELVSIDTNEQSSGSLIIRPLRIRLPRGYEPRSCGVRRVLVGSGKEIFTIETKYGGRLNREVVSIHVFKLDWTSLIWERVNSANDKVFFLGSRYAISCPAAVDSDQARNCVYFTEDTDKDLCMYDIADGSISLLLPCPNLSTPWSSPSPFWVMPDLRLPNFNTETLNITGNEEQMKEGGGGDKKEEGSKDVTEKDDNENIEAKEGLNLVNLPSEILQSISKLLVPGDYMNFRAVSTLTRELSPLIEWRTAMSGSDRSNYPLPSPWLMNFEKTNGVCSFVDPTRGDRYFVRIPKTLQDAVLCHCKDGWLLLSQEQRSPMTGFTIKIWLSFFNPFTKKIVAYPALPSLHLSFGATTSFGFSSVPSSSNCVVVVTTFHITWVGIYTSRSREEEWILNRVQYDPFFQPSCSIPIFADKAFYFMGERGNLGVLRIEEGQGCNWEVLENTNAPCGSFDRNFLAELDGMLLSIFVGAKGKWVKVFKLNPSTMGWERVVSLGNSTLYITALSALAAVAKTPKMEEQIFFSRFYGKNVASYSLSTGMHHYSCGGEEGSLNDYYGTREQLSSCWIVPRWH